MHCVTEFTDFDGVQSTLCALCRCSDFWNEQGTTLTSTQTNLIFASPVWKAGVRAGAVHSILSPALGISLRLFFVHHLPWIRGLKYRVMERRAGKPERF